MPKHQVTTLLFLYSTTHFQTFAGLSRNLMVVLYYAVKSEENLMVILLLFSDFSMEIFFSGILHEFIQVIFLDFCQKKVFFFFPSKIFFHRLHYPFHPLGMLCSFSKSLLSSLWYFWFLLVSFNSWKLDDFPSVCWLMFSFASFLYPGSSSIVLVLEMAFSKV